MAIISLWMHQLFTLDFPLHSTAKLIPHVRIRDASILDSNKVTHYTSCWSNAYGETCDPVGSNLTSFHRTKVIMYSEWSGTLKLQVPNSVQTSRQTDVSTCVAVFECDSLWFFLFVAWVSSSDSLLFACEYWGFPSSHLWNVFANVLNYWRTKYMVISIVHIHPVVKSLKSFSCSLYKLMVCI